MTKVLRIIGVCADSVTIAPGLRRTSFTPPQIDRTIPEEINGVLVDEILQRRFISPPGFAGAENLLDRGCDRRCYEKRLMKGGPACAASVDS